MSESRDSFRRLIVELGRRRVFRTAALYLIFALVAVEVTEALISPLDLPLRSVTMVAWAAILGFPIAVGLAWTYDVTPRGIVRTPPESDVDRRRRRVATQVGFRLTLTGVAAAAVGATTWVVLEPFLPEIEEPVAVEDAPALRSGTLHVASVKVAADLDPALAGRVRLLLLGRLSEEPDLVPLDPREIAQLREEGDAGPGSAAREAGARRVLAAELTRAPEGLRLTLTLRDVGGRSGSAPSEASAAGPADNLQALVDRVVTRLTATGGATESPAG